MKTIKIRQATSKGYIEMIDGGVCDLAYPTSKIRRGRVQRGGKICPTIASTMTLYKIWYEQKNDKSPQKSDK